MKLDSALWFVTYKCPYKCPYCWQGGIRDNMPHAQELPVDMSAWVNKWAAAWNRLNPGILDFTGGEPTLLDIPGLLHSMNPGIKVAITTNLSNIPRICCLREEFTNERIVSWTVSYHPSQMDAGADKVFWNTVEFLRQKDFGVAVNLVGWPSQLSQVGDVVQKARSFGARFHFDPYAVPTGHKVPIYTQEQLQVIKDNTGVDRSPSAPKVVNCKAGSKHLVVFPDGAAYPCLDWYLNRHVPAVGCVLEDGFNLFDKPVVCDRARCCAGCDKDKVKATWEVC